VSPVRVNTSPIMMEAKMNITDGSMKSLKASLAGRMRNSACSTPMARLVMPMGTTSKTHQVPASRKTAKAPLASRLSRNRSPWGSMASGQGGLA